MDELPRDRSTLLVRIMAAGPALPEAIADLAALPEDAYERVVAEQIVVHLRHVIALPIFGTARASKRTL